IAGSPSTLTRLYASSALNGLGVSDDGGATWSFVAATLTPGPSSSIGGAALLMVDPQDSTKLFLGGLDLFRSVDSGSTWTQISHWYGGPLPYLHADQHAAAFARAGTRVLYLGHDGGLSFTDSPYQTIPVGSGSGTYPELPRYYDSSQNTGRGDVMMYHLG